MANLDNITEIRVASFPLSVHGSLSARAAMLSNPAALWTPNNGSALIVAQAADETTSSVVANDRPWRGADAPEPRHVWVRSGGTQGESRPFKYFAGRPLTLPLSEGPVRTASPTAKEQLMSQIATSPAEECLVGFKRAAVAESRYLLSPAYAGGFDRDYRGESGWSNFRLRLKSEWPWIVSHNTVPSGTPFTPSGEPDIVWGLSWSSAISSPLSVSVVSAAVGNTESVYTWAASGQGRTVPSIGIICESFPFEEHTNSPGASGAAPVPQYLQPGSSYTITAAGCTVFWFENHWSI